MSLVLNRWHWVRRFIPTSLHFLSHIFSNCFPILLELGLIFHGALLFFSYWAWWMIWSVFHCSEMLLVSLITTWVKVAAVWIIWFFSGFILIDLSALFATFFRLVIWWIHVSEIHWVILCSVLVVAWLLTLSVWFPRFNLCIISGHTIIVLIKHFLAIDRILVSVRSLNQIDSIHPVFRFVLWTLAHLRTKSWFHCIIVRILIWWVQFIPTLCLVTFVHLIEKWFGIVFVFNFIFLFARRLIRSDIIKSVSAIAFLFDWSALTCFEFI